MKILSYNVMSGGFDSYENKEDQPQRLKLIQNAVKDIDADIVSLIDTYRWDEIYTNKELCKLFDYKKAYCVNLDDNRLKKLGHNNGITILSNLENINFKTINLKSRNSVLSSFKLNNSEINLFSLYLDDLSEDVRLDQVNELTKYIKHENKNIIIGDFNSLSPKNIDSTKEKIDNFLSKNPQFAGLKNQLDDMMRAEVISKFLDLDFKDASTNNVNTAPTKLTNLTDEALLRLDFCLYKNLDIKKLEVLTDEIYDKTSDHYPLLIEV